MKRKLVSVLLLASMTIGLLAGCGNTEDNGSSDTSVDKEVADSTDDAATDDAAADASDEEVIYDARTVTVYLNGMDEEQKTVDAIAEIEAMDKYKNVEFNWVGRDPDFNTKMPVEVAGGVPIDLIIVANPIFLTTYANEGLLVPLDDIAADAGLDFQKEFGDYADDIQIDGETYMIPHNVTSWALTYNKDMFDAAGVEYPAWDVPMTWDEYEETAKAISSGTGSEREFGAFYIPWGTFSYGEAIITLGGGENFYNEEGLSNIEDPAFATALERVHRMMHEDGSMQTHANVKSSSTQVTDFMNGTYGMALSGTWYLNWASMGDVYPRDWTMGIAPMPVDSGTETKTWGVVNGYGVPVSAPDPAFSMDLAYDLAYYAGKYADNTMSAIQTVSQDNLFVATAENLAEDGITLEMLTKAFGKPDTYLTEKITGPNNVAYEAVYTEEVEKYLVNEQDLETTIANIKERGDKAILGN